jgi:hypothetical protein
MFAAWKRGKAIAASKQALGPMLAIFQKPSSFSEAHPIPPQFWEDSFFMGFFYNVIRFWTRVLYTKSEPSTDELSKYLGQSCST